ncbi:Ankyrin repeat like protein [Argiope bruennichi]|uniref:Ankyrin repeat like protein n=1 Tax=Argiope bruennichi TaxID=94029 RepID=A0A8T0F321_ARGBR|nr:Ankyrin repeat like protein [Argiope bruennichi]
MSAVPGGMESDSSDSESEIIYSSHVDSKPKNRISSAQPEKKFTPNGYYKNHNSNNFGKYENRYNNNNYRGSSKFRPHYRNRYQQTRRQCLDYETSQILDDLRYAVMQGNLDTIKNILSKGICVDTILKAGWTSLMYACSSGQAEVVAYLLENKADPNYHKDMFTPLMAVCAAKKPEEDLVKCCSILLQHGAKVNAHERHLTTPLMFAVREGHSFLVKELLNQNADPNLRDSRGNTALAWAASSGYGQIARLLVEKGADVNICNNMGQSPVDLAYENGHNEIVSLLQNGHFIKEDSSTESCKDLIVKKGLSALDISKEADSKKFATVGRLELFLNGVGCGKLIPIFLEHQLSFDDLLIMDDTELEKIGITQVGVRNKLLEACKSVHKAEWKQSSLPNLKEKQYISCPDAVGMMANIAKHLKYISTSVKYIRLQIQAQPRILELSQDAGNVYDLIQETDVSLVNAQQQLIEELRFLKMHLEKVQDQGHYIPADVIVETIPTCSRKKQMILISVGVTAISVAMGGILWKNPNALDFIPSLQQIKLPFLT